MMNLPRGGIKIIFSLPRSGSGLCGAILGVPRGEGGFDRDIANPKPIDYVLEKAREYNGIWTHYPHTEEMEEYLRQSTEFKCYVNLRDPRDIIVSYARVVRRNRRWWLNYKYQGKRVANLDWEQRVDGLIECMHDELYRHHKWLQSGICMPMYYSKNVNHPLAETWTRNKERGIVGSHNDEMTQAQIDRCWELYRPLIKAWS